MRKIDRDFTPTQGVRSNTPLLVGISGPPGSGKTFSAIRLAMGIKADRGGPVILLDTDGDRGLHYCPRPGEKPDNVNTFDVEHVSFLPPHSPLDFLAAIRQQLQRNPAAIVVDSMSDEHEGEGGVLWMADAYLDKQAGTDWAKRDRLKSASWIEPKAERLAFIGGVNRVKTPVIFCFRAREKTKPLKDPESGKTKPTNIGWTPIAPAELVGMMTLFCLLPARSDGFPMWKGSTAYEDFSIKLPAQFRGFIRSDMQVNEEMGRAMSEWARGAPPTGTAAQNQPQSQAPQIDVQAELTRAQMAADKGNHALTEHLRLLTRAAKDALRPHGDDLRARAAKVGQQSDNAQAAPGASTAAPSDDDMVYSMVIPTGETITFENERAYLVKYREIVTELFQPNRARDMLAFDNGNRALIASVVGLKEAVDAVDAEIRPRPAAGGLNV